MDTKQFDNDLQKLSDLGMQIIIEEAKRIMKKHPKYNEFLMAMGSRFFLDKTGNIINDDPKCAEKLLNFIDDNDEAFHFTGSGIRFKADGAIVTNW